MAFPDKRSEDRRLTDERGEKELVKEFHYEGGIKEFVTYLNRSKEALLPGDHLL